MDRKLFLHIGMGRCGSRAIQGFARENSAKLLEKGIAYPTGGDLGAAVGPKHDGNGTGVAQELRKTVDAATSQRAIARMCQHVRSLAVPNCLISSEFFYPVSPENFQALKRAFNEIGFDVVVICYIREQREWMISKFAQALKRGRNETLEESLLRSHLDRGLDYEKQFGRLREVFGRERVVLRIFERARLMNQDVRSDVISLLGINGEDLVFPSDDANVSGNLLQTGIMQVMNAQDKKEYFRFNNAQFLELTRDLCASGRISNSKELYRLAPPKLMRSLLEHFQQPNERFKAEFFPDLQGPLFTTSIPDDYPPIQTSELISADSILLFNEYVDKRMERRRKARRLRSELGLRHAGRRRKQR